MMNLKLRELRKQRGVTQEQLAFALGVSSRAVKYWEHGTRTPSVSSLLALAHYFNVSPEWLMK